MQPAATAEQRSEAVADAPTMTFATTWETGFKGAFHRLLRKSPQSTAFACVKDVLGIVVTFPTIYCTPKNSKALPIGEGVPVSGTSSLGPGGMFLTAHRVTHER